MAIVTASAPGVAVNMFEFMMFAPPGAADIGSVSGGGASATVLTEGGGAGLIYSGTGLGFSGLTPETGTYGHVALLDGATETAAVDLGARRLAFADITTEEAYRLFDGDDQISGSRKDDILFTGDGGNDTVAADKGDDWIWIPATAGRPVHDINGGAGLDTIAVDGNTVSGADTLDLRDSQIRKVERLAIEAEFAAIVSADQIDAGRLAPDAAIEGGGLFQVAIESAGNVDLSRFALDPAMAIRIDGSAGGDTIIGSALGERLRPGAGADTVRGNGGDDRIVVGGNEALSDVLLGGGGSDAIVVNGKAAASFRSFIAADQSIEIWTGNGKALRGTDGVNTIMLGGLDTVEGLKAIEGLAGSDRIVGTGIADVIRGGKGADKMTGGNGDDRFDFDSTTEIGKASGSRDTVVDFQPGDELDFSSIDADRTADGNQRFSFRKNEGAAFTESGQIVFEHRQGQTLVRGDTDGDGKADFVLKLLGALDLVKDDFVL